MKKISSTQNWLPYKEILENGMVLLKDNSLIKILEIKPINYNLKSKLEKEAILNSYKIFLKTCNFDMQILIQSSKEDLSKHILDVIKENNNLNLSKQYINFIKDLNKNKKSSTKKFYLILKEIPENKKIINENNEKILSEKLNDNYFKIKECLYRCGNIVYEIDNYNKCYDLLSSFFKNNKIIGEKNEF